MPDVSARSAAVEAGQFSRVVTAPQWTPELALCAAATRVAGRAAQLTSPDASAATTDNLTNRKLMWVLLRR
jgi:hypothetical protein